MIWGSLLTRRDADGERARVGDVKEEGTRGVDVVDGAGEEGKGRFEVEVEVDTESKYG